MGRLVRHFSSAKLCLLLAMAACPAALFAQTASLAVSAKPAGAPADLTPLLGSYAGEEKQVVEVFENDGRLELKDGGNPVVPILKDSDDHFSVTGELNGSQVQIPVQFVRSDDGDRRAHV